MAYLELLGESLSVQIASAARIDTRVPSVVKRIANILDVEQPEVSSDYPDGGSKKSGAFDRTVQNPLARHYHQLWRLEDSFADALACLPVNNWCR